MLYLCLLLDKLKWNHFTINLLILHYATVIQHLHILFLAATIDRQDHQWQQKHAEYYTHHNRCYFTTWQVRTWYEWLCTFFYNCFCTTCSLNSYSSQTKHRVDWETAHKSNQLVFLAKIKCTSAHSDCTYSFGRSLIQTSCKCKCFNWLGIKINSHLCNIFSNIFIKWQCCAVRHCSNPC